MQNIQINFQIRFINTNSGQISRLHRAHEASLRAHEEDLLRAHGFSDREDLLPAQEEDLLLVQEEDLILHKAKVLFLRKKRIFLLHFLDIEF